MIRNKNDKLLNYIDKKLSLKLKINCFDIFVKFYREKKKKVERETNQKFKMK